MEYIVFAVLFFLCIPLICLLVFLPVMKDKKARNNVRNSDSVMQHYCFVLKCDQQEAIRRLSIPNVMDALEYTFDSNTLTITFTRFGVSIDHQLSFYTIEDRTYLKVSRMRFFHGKSNIPLMINRFFVNKIDAVPVNYTYFESVVCSTKR